MNIKITNYNKKHTNRNNKDKNNSKTKTTRQTGTNRKRETRTCIWSRTRVATSTAKQPQQQEQPHEQEAWAGSMSVALKITVKWERQRNHKPEESASEDSTCKNAAELKWKNFYFYQQTVCCLRYRLFVGRTCFDLSWKQWRKWQKACPQLAVSSQAISVFLCKPPDKDLEDLVSDLSLGQRSLAAVNSLVSHLGTKKIWLGTAWYSLSVETVKLP